jgi:hypothetical protein
MRGWAVRPPVYERAARQGYGVSGQNSDFEGFLVRFLGFWGDFGPVKCVFLSDFEVFLGIFF